MVVRKMYTHRTSSPQNSTLHVLESDLLGTKILIFFLLKTSTNVDIFFSF